jgi:hypothetical protein
MRNRRAALEGLARILDADAPEELFGGGEEDASFLYGLLADTIRARSSSYYWEICRTARRRGVTPEYVVDRAAVLYAAIKERRRTDLYRILGVPALASGDAIRHRWLEVAKRHHPDVGGDAARFRQAKQAYEVLRDPARRAEYERFWVRALGPFERVAPAAGPALDAPPPSVFSATDEPVAMADVVDGRAAAAGDGTSAFAPGAADAGSLLVGALGEALAEATRVLAARASLDRRIGAVADEGGPGLAALLARLEGALAPIPLDELRRLSAEVAQATVRLEAQRDELARLAALRRRLDALSA